ncbi:hypothetical protein KKG52_03470 [Patescibacteria group bacterium]|nr:hypothetical protein [Patescibacteria group bacterium]
MKQKEILLLVISFFLIVVFYVGFSIYHNYVNSTISEKLNTTIIPINPDFDLTTINSINTRKEYFPLYEMELVKEESITPSATPSGQQSEENPEEELSN